MKLMHLESGRHLYGGARQVGYLIDGLARCGVDNLLLAPPGQPLLDAPPDCSVVEMPMRGDLDVGMTARIRDVIRRQNPDLIHVHSRRGAEFFGGRAAARESKPAILTRRVVSADWRAWARIKYRPYAKIVAISRSVAAELTERAGVSPERLARIPSAVDTDKYRPDSAARARLLKAFSLHDDARPIGLVAQLIPRKGHRLMLDCLPALLDRHPSAHLLCFGRGPEERRLRRTIAARGLGRQVTLAGHRDDIAELMPGLELLVHPAVREGLGVAVLEAMSAAVPVVVSAASGAAELVEGGAGLSFPPGERDNLTAAVDRLLSDAAARERLGAAGRRRARQDYSIEAMTRCYLSLYEEILQNR